MHRRLLLYVENTDVKLVEAVKSVNLTVLTKRTAYKNKDHLFKPQQEI